MNERAIKALEALRTLADAMEWWTLECTASLKIKSDWQVVTVDFDENNESVTILGTGGTKTLPSPMTHAEVYVVGEFVARMFGEDFPLPPPVEDQLL